MGFNSAFKGLSTFRVLTMGSLREANKGHYSTQWYRYWY